MGTLSMPGESAYDSAGSNGRWKTMKTVITRAVACSLKSVFFYSPARLENVNPKGLPFTQAGADRPIMWANLVGLEYSTTNL